MSGKLPKTFGGKSTKLGMGGRAKMLESKGVPQGVIGEIARKKHAAPGQANFHGHKPQVKTPVKSDRGTFSLKG